MTTHSKSLMVAGGNQASTANTVQYWRIAGKITVSSTEAQTELVFRNAGWLSNLTVILSANSVTGSTVFLLRKNTTTNLTQTVTFGSTATGTQEDTTHEDYVAEGDRIVLKSTPGAATNTFTVRTITMLFYADVNTVTKFASGVCTTASASTTSYSALNMGSFASSETTAKCRMRKAGTLKNLGCYVSANRAQASTVRLRKNGTTDGNNVVTITGGGAAGWYEDLTPHSDTVTVADDWYYTVTTGTGVDTLTIQTITCDFISTAGNAQLFTGDAVNVADATSRYFQVGGTVNNLTSGETGATGSNLEANAAFTATEMTVLVTANDVGSASTCRLRVGAANVNNTITITANTPGLYGDTTPHTDVLAANSLIDYIVTVPSVSGNHNITVAVIGIVIGMTELTLVPQTYTHLYNIKNLVEAPSLSFDGNDDAVDCGNHSGLWSQALSKFSFSCWIYPKTLTSGSFRAIFIHATSAFENAVDCYLNSGGGLTFDMNDTGAAHLCAAGNTVVVNKWQHVIGTYDSSLAQNTRIKLYVDNVVGSQNGDSATTGMAPNVSASLSLGDDLTASSSGVSFDGYIKDFRWFNNKALDSTERTNVYNNSSSAPIPDYWLRCNEGTGTPVDFIGGKTTTFVNNTTWVNSSPTQIRGKTFAHRYNIRNLATQIFTHKYGIRNLATQIFTHIYNILAIVPTAAQTFTHIYKIRNLATGTYTHKWNIKNLISKTYTHKWNIKTLISQIFTHKWNIKNLVNKTFTHKWNIINFVAKTFTHKWNILNLTNQSFTHKWNILNLISQTFTHKYNIKTLAAQTFSHIYKIANLASQTFSHKYNILNLIAQTFSHKYNIKTLISQAFTHLYSINNLVSTLFTHKYNIINFVSQTFTHIYNILGLGAVAKSFIHKYNIANLTAQTYTHKWNILNLISQTFTHKYGILTLINQIFTHKYNIKTLVNQAFTHSYKIANLVSQVFTHKWNINNLVAQTFTHLYNILTVGLVSAVYTHKYNIRNLANKTYTHKWNILQIINQSFTHRYNILMTVYRLFTHRYNIKNLANQTFTHFYNILNLLQVSQTFAHRYNIRNLASKTFTHRYDIKSLAVTLLGRIRDYLFNQYSSNNPPKQ